MKNKILVVDDEQDLVYTVKVGLEANGYEVITAADGNEALAMVRRDKPDLIILDVMLPKIDGYKVCRLLKFDEKYKKIPIIIFTARTQPADMKLAQEVGADSYITKPFDSQALIEKIKELLKQ